MNPTHDETWRARVHLAAANRLAVYDDLEEGIDNHFTMRVPGQDDRYLVLPFGQHWSEARASDLIVFNEAGDVLDVKWSTQRGTHLFLVRKPLDVRSVAAAAPAS